jgi:hypothetical protein
VLTDKPMRSQNSPTVSEERSNSRNRRRQAACRAKSTPTPITASNARGPKPHHYPAPPASIKNGGGVRLRRACTRPACFTGVPWQRCQFHLFQNALHHARTQEIKREVVDDLRAIFDAPDEPAAKRQLDQVVAKYKDKAPKLAAWLEENVPEGLTVLRLPPSHRKRLRTTNMLERLNRELKRRTRVATLFPNEASLLRLVSAILIEVSEEWESGKRYVTFNPK